MLRLIEVPELEPTPMSLPVQRLLAEAGRRIDRYLTSRSELSHRAFVPSDYMAAYAHLAWIDQQRLATGSAFCEWGSGFGVVAMLAALQGFDAAGVEVDAELVKHARQLAEDLEIPVEFGHGSAIPEVRDNRVERPEDLTYIDTDSPSGYDDLDLGINDFDVYYAFPWPGEERFWDDLFAQYAPDGALLLTYHGVESFRLQRQDCRGGRYGQDR